MDVAEAIQLVQLAFHLADEWRNPVLVFGDYYLAHTYSSVAIEPLEFGRAPAKEWALDGSSSGTGQAKMASPLAMGKRGNGAGDLSHHFRHAAVKTGEMLAGIEPLADVGFCDDAEVVVVAFGTAGKYVRYAVSQLRDEGRRVGLRPSDHAAPFPPRPCGRRRRPAPGSWRCTRTTRGRWSTTSGWRWRARCPPASSGV